MKFAHLAQRFFNTPLALHPAKAEIVMAALGERFGVTNIVNVQNGKKRASEWDDDEGFSSAKPTNRRDRGYDLIEGIARIPVEGTLVAKLGSVRPYSGMTGYDSIRAAALDAVASKDVKGIMLDIDSGGGEVAGCFDLVDCLYGLRGRKPIHAILSESAYSAAYAIASAADRISVPRTGGVGSIGVITMHCDMSGALDEHGLKVTIIHYGERKADGTEVLPLSKIARDRIQADVDRMGDLFVLTVARNRGLKIKAVRDTQAATFTGQLGVDIGLADEVASPDQAFKALWRSIQ